MVRHVVMWKFEEPGAKETAGIAREKLMALVGRVPELLSCEVGVNAGSDRGCYDAVLVSSFEDFDALARYKAHPAHLEAAGFIRARCTDRKVVDFVTEE